MNEDRMNEEELDWIGEIDFSQTNINEIIDLCLKCNTKEEAFKLRERFRVYCVTPEIADENLGYIFGYCNAENRKKLYSLFPVNHPAFGSSFGRENECPTPEEAFRNRRGKTKR